MISNSFRQSNSQSFLTRLAAFLNMQPGETRPVGLITGLYFTLILGFVFLQSTAFGLFISEFGAQSLPYAYISIAVLTSLIAFLYLKLSNRINFSRLVTLNLIFLSAMCMIFWAGLGTTLSRWFIFLLPFWFQTQINLISLVIWPLAGRAFDLRQAKRLFGLIGSGTWLANLIGGFIVAPFAAVMGARNLLLITAAMTALAIWVLQAALRTSLPKAKLAEAAKDNPGKGTSKKVLQQKKTSLIKDPYTRLIFAYTIIWWVSFYFIDNMFYDRAGAQFADSAQLAGFIGQLLSSMGIVALITTIFITGRVITRYGLKTGLLVMPVLSTITIFGMALVGTLNPNSPLLFWLATISKLVNVALGFTISQSASTLLYQPLPGAQRTHTQTVTEGIIQPLSVGLAGLMLLLLNTILHLGVVLLSYVFLVIAVSWILVIFLLAAQYPKLLSRVLERRQVNSDANILVDATSIEVLKQNLNSPHSGVVLYSMNRLQEWDPEAWKAILLENLPSLLAHDRTQVRKKVLENIEQLGLVEAIPVLNGILQKKDDPEVMAAALAALAALGGPDTLEKIAHFSRDPNPVIQRGALVALMRYGGIDGVLEAGQVFKELVQSPDVQKRILAAEILEEVNSAQFYQPLVALINDHDPGVRRAAIRAAGSINNPHLWPALLDACASPEIQNQAEQALVSVGPPILPFIAARLHCSLDEMPSYLEDTEIRSAESFIDICGRIGGEEAINILITQLGTHNMTLRQGVISALRHCEFRSVPGDIQLNLLLSEEAHLGAWLIAFQARPENSPRALLLDSVLAHMLRDVRDRMLGILSFQYDAQSMQRAHMALSEGGSSKEALAIEVIENQLPSKIKSWVMPFLEQSSLDEKLKRLQSANIHVSLPEGDAALLALLDGNIHLPTDTAQSDPIMFSAWTRASILHLIGTHGLRKCLPSVLASCSSNNLLVRKSAEWARDRLEDNTKGVVMLSPIEKILILKSASVFSNVPDDALADVVFHLEEVDVAENETIFNKGEPGDSMYIVVCGKVRIHDKERILNDIGEGEVFGEMALLDPEPRSASVTAVEPSRLLRLEQEPFMDLLAQQPVVATGIIRNLARYLRARVEDINDLDARLREVEGARNR